MQLHIIRTSIRFKGAATEASGRIGGVNGMLYSLLSSSRNTVCACVLVYVRAHGMYACMYVCIEICVMNAELYTCIFMYYKGILIYAPLI